ncbi:uncharacterized protein LOC143083913 [Mytilus galloprovincialis]|uniref:uncharacterized protein LOC143083913 n=1 Tax=Mytilus galloprovincialis TaxID=29158 RepID=UPI003F7B3C23
MLIVDTPGIGPDNPELTERLYQYLPKALAFIYVINTPNAGGIQSDRIFQIRDVLMKQNQDEHMSVFDPERAIFICNKWDQIHEEPDKVFQIVQDTLDESWIGFDPDKLYRLSAREEMQNSLDGNPVSQDFTDILKGIESMIPATIREKYHRHLHWQRKFIERLLMKLSTRIRNSHKSKQDKKEMRENIRKRIQSVKENLLLKKQAVQSKAKTQSKEIAKNVFDHLQSKDTFDRMFKWTEDDLPSHGNIHEIKRVIDKLVFDYITQELRKKLQETEVSKLSDMIEHLFKSECFLIDRECETIDGILLGEEETCISRKINALDRSTSFELSDIGLKGTKGKILLAVSSPFILAFGLILLPVGVTCVISDKLNNEMKLSEYNSDKISFANKRAEKMLTKLSVQVLNTTIEDSLLKKINFRITEFFYKEIPRRINAGDKLMENISKDLRQPREIRKHSYSMQKDVMPVYGQIIFASMAVFGENITKSDHIAETKGVATIKLNNEKITVAVKSMRYKKNNNDKYTSTAEVYSMRDLHHQNVVKFYGICPFNDHVLEGFDFFTEYCGENLDNKVFDEHIRWRKSLHYIKDGLEGLIYLHQSGIVHRNIRLAAILIKDGEAKLSDGGITMRKILKGNISGGVPIVRAPEVLLCDYCGHESDMFQVGIVLWEAFYTKRAFLDKSAKTTYEELIKRIVNGERPSLVDPYPQITIRHKIEDCWEKGLDERPSAKDVRDVITAFIESSPIAN